MKKIIILFVLLMAFLATGCGGGGGSSNPSGTLTGPAITSIFPTSGDTTTEITIYGSRFGVVQGSSILSYGGVNILPNFWSDTQIKLYLPANSPTNQKFLVNVAGVYSNESTPFTFSNMKIFSVTPSTGTVGSQISISGQGFGTFQSGAYVTFYDQSQPSITATANITSWSDTLINCTVPNLAVTQSGNIGLAVWANATTKVITSFNLVIPSIGYVSPAIDNIGATITIGGQGFGQTQGNSYVTIGGSYATVVTWSDSQIQVKVPQVSAAGAHTIVARINNRDVISNVFSVSGPVATNHAPATIGFGNNLTIYGSHFGAAADFDGSGGLTRNVYIETYGYVNSVNWSDNSISFSWPVSNGLFTKTLNVTIEVGGLTTVRSVTAE